MRRVEGNCRSLTTSSAFYRDFDPLPNAGCLRRRDGREAIVFCLLTILAAFGRILELLVAKEGLLSRGPDEIATAINADDRLVFKLRLNASGRSHFCRSPVEIAVRHTKWFVLH